MKDRPDVDSEIFVSSAVVQEVEIKQALGKLNEDGDLAERVAACEGLTLMTRDRHFAAYGVAESV